MGWVVAQWGWRGQVGAGGAGCGLAPPAQVRGERASRWLHAPTTRTVCFERFASSAGGPAERRPLVNARNSPRGCRVTASRLQGRKRLFGGKLHNEQPGRRGCVEEKHNDSYTEACGRRLGQGCYAEFDTGGSAGPSRMVEVDRAVPRRAHHIVTVELEQHIIVKLEQDKTRVGRDMNSWRSY